jgi:hypothetical protein
MHTRIKPLAGDDHAFHLCGSEDVFVPLTEHVYESRLRTDHHAEVSHFLRCLGCRDDGMFDAVARVGARVGIHGCFIGFEGQICGSVANAMDADLQPCVVQVLDGVLEHLRIPGWQAPFHTICRFMTVSRRPCPSIRNL